MRRTPRGLGSLAGDARLLSLRAAAVAIWVACLLAVLLHDTGGSSAPVFRKIHEPAPVSKHPLPQ